MNKKVFHLLSNAQNAVGLLFSSMISPMTISRTHTGVFSEAFATQFE